MCRNLSTGGVFLDTSVGLELGTVVELEITPGQGAKAIKMRAEVVRVEEEPVSTGSKVTMRARGMALRFVDSDPNEVARLLTLAQQMQNEGSRANDLRKERRG